VRNSFSVQDLHKGMLMTTINDLDKATFIALETFKKSGEGVITPTWVTGENGKLYVWTDLNRWKVKRIRNNPVVRLCKSDGRGNPKGAWFEARAKILDSDEAREKGRTRFKAKYGLQFRMFDAVSKNAHKVVIEIEGL
jgi:PPOX class probable F420-dependent enzyme